MCLCAVQGPDRGGQHCDHLRPRHPSAICPAGGDGPATGHACQLDHHATSGRGGLAGIHKHHVLEPQLLVRTVEGLGE